MSQSSSYDFDELFEIDEFDARALASRYYWAYNNIYRQQACHKQTSGAVNTQARYQQQCTNLNNCAKLDCYDKYAKSFDYKSGYKSGSRYYNSTSSGGGGSCGFSCWLTLLVLGACCCGIGIPLIICYSCRCCCFKNVGKGGGGHTHVVVKKTRKRRRVKRPDGHSSSESYSSDDHKHHHHDHMMHGGMHHMQGGYPMNQGGMGMGGQGQPQGYQNDSGPYWACLCDCEHGLIPGKVSVNNMSESFYPWGGRENICHEFRVLQSNQYGYEPDGQPQGNQNDSGPVYAVIVDTPHGKIPGKAGMNGVAFYSYGGGEHEQHGGFMYIMGNH